jgi:hypothetical protein
VEYELCGLLVGELEEVDGAVWFGCGRLMEAELEVNQGVLF